MVLFTTPEKIELSSIMCEVNFEMLGPRREIMRMFALVNADLNADFSTQKYNQADAKFLQKCADFGKVSDMNTLVDSL